MTKLAGAGTLAVAFSVSLLIALGSALGRGVLRSIRFGNRLPLNYFGRRLRQIIYHGRRAEFVVVRPSTSMDVGNSLNSFQKVEFPFIRQLQLPDYGAHS